MFDKLMGSDPSMRRAWIEANIDFSVEDDFDTTFSVEPEGESNEEVIDND
jgi:hypothetical protein